MHLPAETSGQIKSFSTIGFFYRSYQDLFQATNDLIQKAIHKGEKAIIVLPNDYQKTRLSGAFQDFHIAELSRKAVGHTNSPVEIHDWLEFPIIFQNKWLSDQSEKALQDGFSSLILWADMTNEVLKSNGFFNFFDQAVIRQKDLHNNISIFCAYDQSRIDLNTLFRLFKQHPLLSLNGKIISNPIHNPSGQSSHINSGNPFSELLSIIENTAALTRQIEEQSAIRQITFEDLPFGYLLCDENGKIISLNSKTSSIFGYTQIDGVLNRSLADFIIGEDRATALKAFFGEPFNENQDYHSLECRFSTHSGLSTPVELKCKWLINPATNSRQLLCFFIDISHHYEIEQALRTSEQRYRFLVEYQGEGVVMIDVGGIINYINEAGAKLIESTSMKIIGRPLLDFIPSSQIDMLNAQLENRRKGLSSSYELTLKTSEGNLREVLVTATPRYTTEGVYNGTLAIFRDITERKQLEEKLRFQSTHDQMTNLYNRAFFDDMLLNHDPKISAQTSIIIVDVDGLKEVNDQDGHKAGDQLILKVAQILIASFRNRDVIARIGGDEFAILLFETDEAQLHQAILRLRHNLEKANASTPEPEQISFSIGGATTNPNRDINQTLILADLRMYRQKRRKKAAHGSQLVE